MSYFDQHNSTTGPQALAAGATFTGSWRDLDEFAEFTILLAGDSGAPGTLYIELSINRVDVIKTRTITVADISDFPAAFDDVSSHYMRVRYVNGATPLTVFQCQTLLHPKKTKSQLDRNSATNPMYISAPSLPLPSGAATEATLSALNTKVPTDPAKESGKLTDIDTKMATVLTDLTDVIAKLNATLKVKGSIDAIVEQDTAADLNCTATLKDASGNAIGSDAHSGSYHLLTDALDTTASGTLGADEATVELDAHGIGSCVMVVSGTWSGKIVVEGTIDSVWVNLSLVQPAAAFIRNGIVNDTHNGSYRVALVASYTKIRARMDTYTSGTASIKFNASKASGTNYVWQLNAENLKCTNTTDQTTPGTTDHVSPIAGQNGVAGGSGTVGATTQRVVLATNVALPAGTNLLGSLRLRDASTGDEVQICDRTQTPTGKAMQVQIGPGDVISNLPVVMQYDHHQIHEGESTRWQDVQSSLGSSTVKYGLTVPTYAVTIRAPHLIITSDVYNGTVLVQLYEGATFTNGSTVTGYNRNRNSATTAGLTVTGGVTSTNGTLIDSFYVGSGTRSAASNRASVEWVLKSNTIYRVDVIGQAAGTACIVGFDSYEDLGV